MDESLDESVEVPLLTFGSATSSNVQFAGSHIHSLFQPLSLPPVEASQYAPGVLESQEAVVRELSGQKELGEEAVWSLSSAKIGNGVEQLRDMDPNTFWQSDGVLPHCITIQFHKKTRVSHVALYLDHKLDESYTPHELSIRVGNGSPATAGGGGGSETSSSVPVELGSGPDSNEIREVERFEVEEPQGWVLVKLNPDPKEEGWGSEETNSASSAGVVRCHFVQIVVLSSFQNGRDTHVRQVKIFGPRHWSTGGLLDELSNLSSVDFQQFAHIR